MVNIPKYPYQKTLFVNNDMELTKGKFSSYNKEDMQEACKILSGGAGYLLWTIFAGNNDMFDIDLSPAWITKNYGISENSYRNGMDDLRKFGYIIDHQHDNYGIEFYCKTVAEKWIDYIPKNRTGKKAEFGFELKKEYVELINSDLMYEDYTEEQQWIYQLGDMYDWSKEFTWKF